MIRIATDVAVANLAQHGTIEVESHRTRDRAFACCYRVRPSTLWNKARGRAVLISDSLLDCWTDVCLMLRTWLLLLVSFSGCQLAGPETEPAPRTYPEALDVEQVPLPALSDSVAVPGTYNVEGFVVNVWTCPEGYMCAVGDRIVVAESIDAEPYERLTLAAVPARQFVVRRRYLISVEVEPLEVDSTQSDRPDRRFLLRGYSE